MPCLWQLLTRPHCGLPSFSCQSLLQTDGSSSLHWYSISHSAARAIFKKYKLYAFHSAKPSIVSFSHSLNSKPLRPPWSIHPPALLPWPQLPSFSSSSLGSSSHNFMAIPPVHWSKWCHRASTLCALLARVLFLQGKKVLFLHLSISLPSGLCSNITHRLLIYSSLIALKQLAFFPHVHLPLHSLHSTLHQWPTNMLSFVHCPSSSIIRHISWESRLFCSLLYLPKARDTANHSITFEWAHKGVLLLPSWL